MADKQDNSLHRTDKFKTSLSIKNLQNLNYKKIVIADNCSSLLLNWEIYKKLKDKE